MGEKSPKNVDSSKTMNPHPFENIQFNYKQKLKAT